MLMIATALTTGKNSRDHNYNKHNALLLSCSYLRACYVLVPAAVSLGLSDNSKHPAVLALGPKSSTHSTESAQRAVELSLAVADTIAYERYAIACGCTCAVVL